MCEKGFKLFNMTNTFLPTMSTNLTELLFNFVAISVVIRSSDNTPRLVEANYSKEYKLSDLAEDSPDVVVAHMAQQILQQ